jgi:hypothetical protein
MPCESCSSQSLFTFTCEIAIHFLGFANIDQPIVWVFPDIVVCLDCGSAKFEIPEREPRVLNESQPGGDSNV